MLTERERESGISSSNRDDCVHTQQRKNKLTLDSFDLSLADDVKLPPPPPWAPELFLLLFDSFCWCVCCCCELLEVPEQGEGATLPDEIDDNEGPDRSRLNSRLLLTSFSF